MKIVSKKKALLLFYGFDIILFAAILLLLIPFNKNKSTRPEKSIESNFLSESEDVTELRILDRSRNKRIIMNRLNNMWIATDSDSNETLYWPCDVQTIENFLASMSKINEWIKVSDNVTSWKKFAVDNSQAVEITFRDHQRTVSSVFFGEYDNLRKCVAFRTSKEATVWETETSAVDFIFQSDSSFWADPYIEPVCITGKSLKDSESSLRRGELVYLKPGDNVKPVKVFSKQFDNGNKAVYSIYEKDGAYVIIPMFEGNDTINEISYRYSVSKWTYEKILKEYENERK